MRRKLAPLLGLPLYQLLSMDSPSMKEHSVMQSASEDLYGGACTKLPVWWANFPVICWANLSVWWARLPVWEFPQFVTMK